MSDAGAALFGPCERVKCFVPQGRSGARLGPAGLQEIDARAGVFVERLDRQSGVGGGAYVLDEPRQGGALPVQLLGQRLAFQRLLGKARAAARKVAHPLQPGGHGARRARRDPGAFP